MGSCSNPLPIFNSLPDSSFSASSSFESEYGVSHGPERSRLFTQRDGNGISCWAQGTNTGDIWIQVDMLETYTLHKIATRGRGDDNWDQKVTAYSVRYSVDGIAFERFNVSTGDEKIFRGNGEDGLVIVLHQLEGVQARYVRLISLEGSGLQWELYVCGFIKCMYMYHTHSCKRLGDRLSSKLQS